MFIHCNCIEFYKYCRLYMYMYKYWNFILSRIINVYLLTFYFFTAVFLEEKDKASGMVSR